MVCPHGHKEIEAVWTRRGEGASIFRNFVQTVLRRSLEWYDYFESTTVFTLAKETSWRRCNCRL